MKKDTGEYIIREGEPGAEFYVVMEGQAKVLIHEGDTLLVWADEWQVAKVERVPEQRRMIPGVPFLKTNAGEYKLRPLTAA